MKDIRTCDDGQSLTISNNECRDHDANKKMKSAYKLQLQFHQHEKNKKLKRSYLNYTHLSCFKKITRESVQRSNALTVFFYFYRLKLTI